MCLGHWNTPGTKGLRMIGVVILLQRRVVDRQRETTNLKSNQLMGVTRKDRRLAIRGVG